MSFLQKICIHMSVIGVYIFFTPSTFAAGDWKQYTRNWGTQLSGVDVLIKTLTYMIPTLVFIFFVWGCAKYIKSGGKDGAQGLKMIGWSLSGFFMMVSVWGIVAFFGDVIGIKPTDGASYQSIQLPTYE